MNWSQALEELRLSRRPEYELGRQEQAFARVQVDRVAVGPGWRLSVSPDVRTHTVCPWQGGRTGTDVVCPRSAGHGTHHPGVGYCKIHGGDNRRRSREAAWTVAHAFAQELDVTPWQALLGEVRRTAGGVAWLDMKVGEAESDEALTRSLEDGGVREYVAWRQREREWLGKVSKMALDAGVAERLVAQVEFEGHEVARVLNNTLERLLAIGLTVELREAARGIMREELLALDGPVDSLGKVRAGATVVDGEVVSPARLTVVRDDIEGD